MALILLLVLAVLGVVAVAGLVALVLWLTRRPPPASAPAYGGEGPASPQ